MWSDQIWLTPTFAHFLNSIKIIADLQFFVISSLWIDLFSQLLDSAIYTLLPFVDPLIQFPYDVIFITDNFRRDPAQSIHFLNLYLLLWKAILHLFDIFAMFIHLFAQTSVNNIDSVFQSGLQTYFSLHGILIILFEDGVMIFLLLIELMQELEYAHYVLIFLLDLDDVFDDFVQSFRFRIFLTWSC